MSSYSNEFIVSLLNTKYKSIEFDTLKWNTALQCFEGNLGNLAS